MRRLRRVVEENDIYKWAAYALAELTRLHPME